MARKHKMPKLILIILVIIAMLSVLLAFYNLKVALTFILVLLTVPLTLYVQLRIIRFLIRPVRFKPHADIPDSIRFQIYGRANNKCENPDCSYIGPPLQIHHIDKDPSNNELHNLIAVCPHCHKRIRRGKISIRLYQDG